MVEQWNSGTVEHVMVEQCNREGGTVEHLVVNTATFDNGTVEKR